MYLKKSIFSSLVTVVFISTVTLSLVVKSFSQPQEWGTVLIFCCGPDDDNTNPPWRNDLIDIDLDISFPNHFHDCTSGQHYISEDAICIPTGNTVYVSEYEYSLTSYWPGAPFLTSVLSQADEDIDFSQYDKNNDDIVDKVHFMIMSDVRGNVGYGSGINYTTNDGVSTNWNQGACIWTWTGEQYPFYRCLNLLIHEDCHTLPIDVGDRYDWGNTSVLGSFNIMSKGSFFPNPNGVRIASMLEPFSRFTRGYLDYTIVESPLFHQEIPDYLPSGTCYKIATDDVIQYFLITNHKRDIIWELYWPAPGMLIWHIKTNGLATSRDNKSVDIEAASGNYEWEYTGLTEDNYPIYINTNTPNPISGYDSLDYWFTGNPENYDEIYEEGKWGTEWYLYRTGDEFSMETNPNSNIIGFVPSMQNVPTNIGIFNIVQDEEYNLWADLVPYYVDENITTNTTWDQDVFVKENITVETGATLTIEPGVTVYFAPARYLIVQGKIVADGEQFATRINFTCSNPDYLWWGIYLVNSNPEGGNYFNQCEFEKCSSGLSINSSKANCENLTFTNASFGMTVYNSNSTINECNFDNNQIGIFLVVNSDAIITDNDFTFNQYAIKCQANSSPQIGFNDFWGNDNYAVHCIDGSNPRMYYNEISSPFGGRNFFNSNNLYPQCIDIIGEEASYPLIGFRTEGNYGENIFDGYDQGGTDYYVQNLNANGSIYAQMNYYNGGDPPTAAQFDGDVIWEPYLPGWPDLDFTGGNDKNTNFDNPLSISVLENLFNQGQIDFALGNYTSAMQNFATVIQSSPNSDLAISSLSFIVQIYEIMGDSTQIIPYLTSISNQALSNNLTSWANLLTVPFYLNNQITLSNALNICSNVANRDSIYENFQALGLFEEAIIYLNYLNQPELAIASFLELIQRFPESSPAEIAEIYYQLLTGNFIERNSPEEQNQIVSLPENFILVEVYPNPFNSSLAIRFEMTDASPYDLVIYDINGREVWRLANRNSQFGTNEVVWNAEGMPSGIYFVRLSAIGYQLSANSVQKVVLLK